MPEAQYALGKLFLSDDWEVRDPDEGIDWLKHAAENGSQLGRLPSGQRVSPAGDHATGYRKSGGVVHPVGGGGKPVRPVHAGQAVPDGTGSTPGSGPGNAVVQPFRGPGKPVRSVLPGAARTSPPALCDAGGHPAALPHEPDLPGQLPAPAPAPASRSTANSAERSRRRRLLWATSRTTMRRQQAGR